ncbi:MAG: methylornithine synthase PylB [Coriobacteriales bacterium]|jgi:methylornithine synthase|nr:methylornithine synthase PylB [Coriobacteriales bacterium]
MKYDANSILALLNGSEGKEELFRRAQQARAAHFGNKVFAYGFNYFSTYCVNHCTFCYYRSSNAQALRYRNDPRQVVEDAKRLASSGVHLIDLTMGEDPYYRSHPKRLADLISDVSAACELPVMISPGVIEAEQLELLKQAGAVWFALYQETFVKEAYERLRIGQDFDRRLEIKREAVQRGLLLEEGILTGWGESQKQVADSLANMDQARPSQVRVMTFVPQKGTPLEGRTPANSDRELQIIAVMRLLYPHKLIPASLDVEGPRGLEARLNAGANVITSLIPPASGLLGVARNDDIEDGARSLAHITPTIQAAGLELASLADYRAFIAKAQAEGAGLG